MTDKLDTKFLTPLARLSFPRIFKPEPNDQNVLKFSATFLFEKGADLKKAKIAVANAIKNKWGDNPPKNLKLPFRDQGDKELEGYEAGAVFISATSEKRPGVVDQNVEAIIDESEIYAGCYVYASLNAFTYGGKGTKYDPGVSFGLNNIQKVKDGEPLGGRTRPEDDFEPINSSDDSANSSDIDDELDALLG